MSHESSLSQPLVSRPAYGRGQGTVAESGLPEGGPADRGLPLDPSIPGSKTFVKPLDDTRDFDRSEDEKGNDEPIYRQDYADDLLKDRSRIDVREDNADKHDGIGQMGKGKPDPRDQSKTKYPYRDDKPNEKNAASVQFVVEAWRLRQAHTLRIPANNRVATVPSEILEGLNPKFRERAARCTVGVKRVDTANLRWIFSVDCGNGPKVVKMKSFRPGTVTQVAKMDMDLKCSCPAWRWLGPEYHAKTEEYIDGKPRGTASVPVIRDPTGINRV